MLLPCSKALTHLCPAKAFSNFAPERLLTRDHLRKTVEKFAKISSVRSNTKKPTRDAAILIPICLVDDEVALLYTLRAANLKSHRSQVSFPGGIRDPSDADLTATALRETEEELGLQADAIEVVGQGGLITNREATTVLPIVGLVRSRDLLKELVLNPAEVTEAFVVPVRRLVHPDFVRHTQFRANYSLPVFTGGKRKIWGLTAIITHTFLACFLPDSYSRSVKFVPPVKKGGLPYRFL